MKLSHCIKYERKNLKNSALRFQGTLSKTQNDLRKIEPNKMCHMHPNYDVQLWNLFLTIKFIFYISKMNEIFLLLPLVLIFFNHSEFRTMWGQNFWFIFWEYDHFILSFWNFLTFSVLAVKKFLSVGKANPVLEIYVYKNLASKCYPQNMFYAL